VVDVWMLGASSYRKFNADDLTYGAAISYPAGSPSVSNLRWPITDGDYIYAQSPTTDAAAQIDLTDESFSRVSVGDLPMMSATDGTSVWVTNAATTVANRSISRINIGTWSVTETITSPSHADRLLWIDPMLWVVDSVSSTATLKVYSLASSSFVHTGTILSSPGDDVDVSNLAYDGTYVYVGIGDPDRIYRIDSTTYAVVDYLAVNGRASELHLVGDYLFMAESVSGTDLVRIDLDTFAIVDTLSGPYTSGLGNLTSNGYDTVYACLATTLQKIDVDTFTVTDTATGFGTVGRIVYAGAPVVPPFTPGPRGLGGWGVGETKDEQW
jgi:hypothetical protein